MQYSLEIWGFCGDFEKRDYFPKFSSCKAVYKGL